MLKLDEILKLLGIDKLEESDQKVIEEKLNTILETEVLKQVDEKVESIIKEEEEKISSKLEERFEEYKNEITEKFSNFVDTILEEELKIPEEVVEWAKVGKTYAPIMEQLKLTMAIDEGILDEEVKDLLKESKDKIEANIEEINSLTNENLEMKSKLQDSQVKLYINEKSIGLPESMRVKVVKLLEGLSSVEEVDKKFDLVVETLKLGEEDKNQTLTEDNKGKGTTEGLDKIEEEENSPIDRWVKVLNG